MEAGIQLAPGVAVVWREGGREDAVGTVPSQGPAPFSCRDSLQAVESTFLSGGFGLKRGWAWSGNSPALGGLALLPPDSQRAVRCEQEQGRVLSPSLSLQAPRGIERG